MAPAGPATVACGVPLEGPPSIPDNLRSDNQDDDDLTRLPEAAEGTASPKATRHGPLVEGQAFGTRYSIRRLLGVGGMGAVYEAWDDELGVVVAIKVIRPDVMADPAAAASVERRFKRELLLARQVTHRNVVRIHDLGDIGGIKYITMSYVEGTDLATLLQQGPQAVPEVMRMARFVVSGLTAAHAAGVVHRDLKPANIMIAADGNALIMDFGIAHSTGDAAAVGDRGGRVPDSLHSASITSAATAVGTIIGTVEYMAPEQAKGLLADERSDIYAFGLILYDALTGRRRTATGEGAVVELQRRMGAAPSPLRTLLPDVPEALERLVARCVAPDPAQRYQSAAALAADLDRLDDSGVPLPVRHVVRLPVVAALAGVAVLAIGGTWWSSRQAPPPTPHAPMSVLIADFDNKTGDPAFDRTLEPMLRLALEEAGFISAIDRTQVRARLGAPAPDKLDERAATQLAAAQGVGMVVSGAVTRQGNGYALTVKAAESVSGKVLTTVGARAQGREQVLPVATTLATEIRTALGDDTSDSTRRFAADTLSATSLDVVRHYARAMEALADGRFEPALASFQQALQGDPNFGLAYVGMAASSRNLDRPQDAERYALEAVRHVDRMTERERYRARGLVYMATGDYQQCLKEFGDMLARYAADVVAYNNLAFCQTQLRRMPEAVNAVRRATDILPKRALYRLNLALYSAYAGDFAAAEQEAIETQQLGSALGLQPLAYAEAGQGRLAESRQTYDLLAKVNAQGASIASSGLGDLAIYEGRFAEAVEVYGRGADVDLQRNNVDRAAAKLAAVAYAELSRGRTGAALASARRAIATGAAVRSQLLAGRVLAQAGDLTAARALATRLASGVSVEAQAASKIIAGNILLQQGDSSQAIRALSDAAELLDTWIGQFDLGRAFLAAGRVTQADSAFDRCLKRTGELFLDEEPAYGYLPSVFYYRGRARETQKSVAFADSYREYLRIRGSAGEDPLLREVRRRAGA